MRAILARYSITSSSELPNADSDHQQDTDYSAHSSSNPEEVRHHTPTIRQRAHWNATGFMAVDRGEPVCRWRCSLDRSRMSRLMIPRGGIKIILHVYKVQGRARHLEDP